MTTSTARRGISVFADSIESMAATAQAADEAGFESIWASELYNRTATVTLAAVAHRTTRCLIASGIMYGVGRSPLMLAAEARDLDELSNGRLILGLGNGTRRMISDWHGLDGDSPAKRMEELVPLLRQVWRLDEQPIDHDGRFYRLRIAALEEMAADSREIPIFTAGVNPRMIETAGRVADGMLGHSLFSPRYIEEVARPAIARGAEHVGRDPGEIELASFVLASVHEDEERARREAAAMLAFYGSVKTYAPLLEHCGFGAEAKAIQEAFARRDVDAMVQAVSDEMIDEFAAAGTADQVRDRLRRWDGALDRLILASPSFRVPGERIAENLRALIRHYAPDEATAAQAPRHDG